MRYSRQAERIRQTIRETLPGIAGVAVITGACFPLHPDFTIVGCFFLLLVVLLSAQVGFAASAIVSVTAVACLDYFFVPPILQWNLMHPLDGLALLTFLATALVVTRLASKAREEAQIANARRRDLARLYEVASRLVSVSPAVAVERRYLNIFSSVFELQAVCLFDGNEAEMACEGKSEHNLVHLTKQAYISGRDYDDRDKRIALRCFRIDGKIAGAVGFQGLSDGEATAGALSILVAAMVQRARSFEAASAAAAATQVEVLRSAILDAFAHQFKTPLAAILMAAGGLRETGPLSPQQDEMVETVESEATGLGRLTTRLLRMARLDRDEIKPRLQATDLRGVTRRIADQFGHQPDGRVLVMDAGVEPVEVLADPEMLGLAIVQLLDNAFRYSPPEAKITVGVVSHPDWAVVWVSNEGSPIPPEERSRIFERFYRGSAGHQVSGTGLGLYVARKIVAAHGGSLELDSEHLYGRDTTFFLRLPVRKQEARHERKAS